MARHLYDLAVKTGEYTDKRTGEIKARWLRVGAMFEHADGRRSIKLDALPVGLKDWDGWVSCFEKRERGKASAHDQDIPF